MTNQGHKVLWANPEALLAGRFHLCAVSYAVRKYALVYVRPSSSTPLSNSSLTTATSDCTSHSACRHNTKEEYHRVPRKWTNVSGRTYNVESLFLRLRQDRYFVCLPSLDSFLFSRCLPQGLSAVASESLSRASGNGTLSRRSPAANAKVALLALPKGESWYHVQLESWPLYHRSVAAGEKCLR